MTTNNVAEQVTALNNLITDENLAYSEAAEAVLKWLAFYIEEGVEEQLAGILQESPRFANLYATNHLLMYI